MENIVIKGARANNLKNIDVQIPQGKLVVITGLSGSGKSSLAFDTLFAEGQRRYVESLSSYARQFLGRMTKPDVDYIHGLAPAVAIEQKETFPKQTFRNRAVIATGNGLLMLNVPVVRPQGNHTPTDQMLISYHEHNARQAGDGICQRILAGESAAIVTDAGMPCISDPGERCWWWTA